MLDADFHLPPAFLGLDARLHEHGRAPRVFHVLLVAEYVERSGGDTREALQEKSAHAGYMSVSVELLVQCPFPHASASNAWRIVYVPRTRLLFWRLRRRITHTIAHVATRANISRTATAPITYSSHAGRPPTPLVAVLKKKTRLQVTHHHKGPLKMQFISVPPSAVG